jgi:hypothetical protein
MENFEKPHVNWNFSAPKSLDQILHKNDIFESLTSYLITSAVNKRETGLIIVTKPCVFSYFEILKNAFIPFFS